MKTDLTLDHKTLEGAYLTRRYFAKFARIMGHLEQVTDIIAKDRLIGRTEADLVKFYLSCLTSSFTALSYKHLMTGRVSGLAPAGLCIDKQESGFPIFQELLQLANDALNAKKHLANLPEADKLKQDMLHHILNEHSAPSRLQFAMSQRLYYQHLAGNNLFLAHNDPQEIWRGDLDNGRRRYLLHWASYDSQTNVPAIYLMDLEDSGRHALPKDGARWPQVQSHLMAQAVTGLKLVTIARGFDQDFDDLHPKRLRRLHVGPMYSHNFTEQSGPLREILAEADGEAGLDWVLSWTLETIWSQDVQSEKTGLFSWSDREIYKLDKMGSKGGQSGASEVRRSLILPERAYQVLEDRDPAGMRDVRKYVLGGSGQILSYE